jgi:hypothetical protein
VQTTVQFYGLIYYSHGKRGSQYNRSKIHSPRPLIFMYSLIQFTSRYPGSRTLNERGYSSEAICKKICLVTYLHQSLDNTMCPYKGQNGYGIITAPSWMTSALLVLVVFGVLMEVIVVCSWLLLVGGGPHVDKCVQMIDNPLRTVYYMRESAGRLVTKISGNDIGKISLLQHLEKVQVRFGEDKKTRGEKVGSLILDDPSRVVKVSKSRKLI